MSVLRPMLWKGTRFALLALGALATYQGGAVPPVLAQCSVQTCGVVGGRPACVSAPPNNRQCAVIGSRCLLSPPCP
jgi:hypothetical protein